MEFSPVTSVTSSRFAVNPRPMLRPLKLIPILCLLPAACAGPVVPYGQVEPAPISQRAEPPRLFAELEIARGSRFFSESDFQVEPINGGVFEFVFETVEASAESGNTLATIAHPGMTPQSYVRVADGPLRVEAVLKQAAGHQQLGEPVAAFQSNNQPDSALTITGWLLQYGPSGEAHEVPVRWSLRRD